MAGVSTESLKNVEQVLAANVADHPEHLAEELFAVVDLLDTNGGLRRGLTDPSRTADARDGITRSILRGKISESTLNVVSAAASARWSEERDLADALERLAVEATAYAAEQSGGAEQVETIINELLTFVNSVNGSAEAQSALSDARASQDAKEKLGLVMAGHPQTSLGELLVKRASVTPRGTTAALLAEKFLETIVARQNRSIAHIETARPLTEAQIEKLRLGLSKVYNRELKLDISVDPSLVGGLRVQVGDEIVDGTVQTRLAELNRSIS